MKLNTEVKQDAQIYGDVSQNRVSIDVKNIDFITQILSSNLYSKPLDSFLREIISNAVDSHVEAGTKYPIILDIGNVTGKIYIRIQDFGTGISKERFDNIYRFIGSSTKRESNDYIGSFGLGRFATLSVSDSCTITSRYNGIETKYLMYKDGMAINIDELSSVPTKERNGVEVYVELNNFGYGQVLQAVKKLIFFRNLYINLNVSKKPQPSYYYDSSVRAYYDLVKYVEEFNKRTFIDKDTFSMCSIEGPDDYYILIGNVPYLVDATHRKYVGIMKNEFSHYTVYPRFDIGELSVTPNREDLLYNENTESTLKKKLDSVNSEIGDLYVNSFDKDIQLNDFKRIDDRTLLILDRSSKFFTIEFDDDFTYEHLSESCTFYGKKLSKDTTEQMFSLFRTVAPFISTHDYNGKQISIKPYAITIKDIIRNRYKYKTTIFLQNNARVINFYLKQYLKEEYSCFTIIKPLEKKEIKLELKHAIAYNNGVYNKNIKDIIISLVKDLWNSFDSVDESLIDEQFKQRFKKETISTTENINVTTLLSPTSNSVRQEKMTFNDFLRTKKVFIYCSSVENIIPFQMCGIPEELLKKDSDFEQLLKKYGDFSFVQVSEKVKKSIFGEENMIYYTELLNPDRYWMRFLKTWKNIKENSEQYKKISDCTQYYYGMSKKSSKTTSDINHYNTIYNRISGMWKYIEPFEKDIEFIDGFEESIGITDEVVNNCIAAKYIKQTCSYDEVYRLLMCSLPNISYDNNSMAIYKSLKQQFSYDKEHNQDEQISECNAQ